MGNVCLGILNGTEVGLENSNIIGGTYFILHALHVTNAFKAMQNYSFIREQKIKKSLIFCGVLLTDISMQDKMVVFNNEKQAIGWATANCDRVPKSRVSSM